MPSTSIPSTLYTGGNVIFNSQPYVQYALQQKAREDAKNEALDKYFMDYDKNINPAGMRNQETEPLLKLMQENKDYYFKNKDRIKNPSLDNGAAYTEFTNRNRAALGFVANSKQQAALDKTLNEHIYQAKQKGESIPDDLVRQIQLSQLPMNHQDFKAVDPYSVQFDNPFDQKEFYSNVWGNTTPSERPLQPIKEFDEKGKPTGRIREVRQTYLDSNDFNAIESRAATAYNTKPATKKFIDGLVKDPNELAKLNEYFKGVHGANIDIQHPEQVAAAYALSLGDVNKTKVGDAKFPGYDPMLMFNLREDAINRRKEKYFANQRILTAGDEGTAFSTFGGAAPLKLKLPSGKDVGVITKGFVTDLDGKPMSGDFTVSKDYVPSAIRGLLKSNGIDDKNIAPKVKLMYKDGNIVGVDFGAKIGSFDENTLKNFQLKANTEPLKGKQPSWNLFKKSTPQSKSKKDPLGLGL